MATNVGRTDVEIDLAADAALRAAIRELTRGDESVRLEAANRLRHAAESILAEFVAEARAVGSTWSDIGDALGVSTQAAHQKYRYVVATTGS